MAAVNKGARLANHVTSNTETMMINDTSDGSGTALEPPTVAEYGLYQIAWDTNTPAAASKAGVHLLAGTDLGDPYVIPGYALHDELELMVKAGVPILKALQSATSEPARAFGLYVDRRVCNGGSSSGPGGA